jgi:hypothetical protein
VTVKYQEDWQVEECCPGWQPDHTGGEPDYPQVTGSTVPKSGGTDVQCLQETSLGTGDRMTVAYADAHGAFAFWPGLVGLRLVTP